ncbi:hypothetical protein Tco_0705159 [Tanacetum coccineum]|uniref:Uncharacterized protein n=1 Tax=Tanacetum coccineum TaxID=301880 RepID=A0ABQ4Y5S9_9ASTR
MPELLRDRLFARMAMEHRDEAGIVMFASQAWRRLFDTRGPLVWELILEFLSTHIFGEVLLDLDAPGTIQFQLGGARRRLSWRQFILALGLYTGEEMESPGFARAGCWIGQHALLVSPIFEEHSGLLTADILGGLAVIAPELLMIDMAELVRLQICVQLDDTWTWVAMGPERQLDAANGAPAVAEDAPAVDEGDQAISVPVQAPQQPPPPLTAARTIPYRLGRLEEDVLDYIDMTFRGSSPLAFQRRVRQRTGEASTSATPQDPQQPDP